MRGRIAPLINMYVNVFMHFFECNLGNFNFQLETMETDTGKKLLGAVHQFYHDTCLMFIIYAYDNFCHKRGKGAEK